ncbi:hypothetical protein S1361_08435 [Streptomyces cyanogenus]|uniref:Uncharacterized protein n=1 Tax=Streptomyces cyanogenus TaxID=80860 RepID=A0ABX7TL85_STRCY|nr:hypothetical protein S1361_08435 [Streptomyces cyanogenus]
MTIRYSEINQSIALFQEKYPKTNVMMDFQT